MNEKLRKLLSEKTKDMGLSKKAIDRLAELGSEGLNDDASDEEVAAKAESLVPFAAAMQSEVTRKTSSTGKSTKSSTEKGEGGEGSGEGEKGDKEMPEWAKKFQDELSALKDENARLKSEKAHTERQTRIAAKAKELGIPDFLMKRVSIADDADFEKELTEYKQDLVNNSLMPKGLAHEAGNTGEQMKADALAWAKGLPDK